MMTTRNALSAAIAVFFAFASGSLARAATPTTDSLTLDAPPATAPAPIPFDNRWRFEVLGVGMADVTNRHVEMGGTRLGIGYYPAEQFGFRLELTGYGVSTSDGDTAAAQASLGFRHHVHEFGRTSLFIDVGFGLFEAGKRVPSHGTDFNLTFHTGVGFTHPIADGLDLEGGLRYFHLSNARLEGPDRNPSLNGPEFFIGVVYRR
jgi:hypothetical protein